MINYHMGKIKVVKVRRKFWEKAINGDGESHYEFWKDYWTFRRKTMVILKDPVTRKKIGNAVFRHIRTGRFKEVCTDVNKDGETQYFIKIALQSVLELMKCDWRYPRPSYWRTLCHQLSKEEYEFYNSYYERGETVVIFEVKEIKKRKKGKK